MDDENSSSSNGVTTINVDLNEAENSHGLAQFPEIESKTRLIVRIKQWKVVGSWRWLANDDSCGICRMAFEACCADCLHPGDDCPLVWGKCTHCFHMHCIMKWLNSQSAQQLCPMCRQEWKFKD